MNILCAEAPPNRFNTRRKSVFAEAYNPEEDDEEDTKKVHTFKLLNKTRAMCLDALE